jgi:hypothetical protein
MTNKVPKLICLITGVMRVTTREYLDAKMLKKGISEEEFCSNYARKDAVRLLREGKTVDQIRAELKSDVTVPIGDETLAKILLYNGKQAKPAKVITPAAPVATAPAAEAPTAVTEPALTIEQPAPVEGDAVTA